MQQLLHWHDMEGGDSIALSSVSPSQNCLFLQEFSSERNRSGKCILESIIICNIQTPGPRLQETNCSRAAKFNEPGISSHFKPFSCFSKAPSQRPQRMRGHRRPTRKSRKALSPKNSLWRVAGTGQCRMPSRSDLRGCCIAGETRSRC